MSFLTEKGDVLKASAEGLLVTIDGISTDYVGRIARQFIRSIGEDEWENLREELKAPTPIGTIQILNLKELGVESTFDYLFVASFLDHQGESNRSTRPTIAYDVISNVLKKGKQLGVKRIASALLTGGWRVTPEVALKSMEAAAANIVGVTLVLRTF
jgi:hypothetical protein